MPGDLKSFGIQPWEIKGLCCRGLCRRALCCRRPPEEWPGGPTRVRFAPALAPEFSFLSAAPGRGGPLKFGPSPGRADARLPFPGRYGPCRGSGAALAPGASPRRSCAEAAAGQAAGESTLGGGRLLASEELLAWGYLSGAISLPSAAVVREKG